MGVTANAVPPAAADTRLIVVPDCGSRTAWPTAGRASAVWGCGERSWARPWQRSAAWSTDADRKTAKRTDTREARRFMGGARGGPVEPARDFRFRWRREGRPPPGVSALL